MEETNVREYFSESDNSDCEAEYYDNPNNRSDLYNQLKSKIDLYEELSKRQKDRILELEDILRNPDQSKYKADSYEELNEKLQNKIIELEENLRIKETENRQLSEVNSQLLERINELTSVQRTENDEYVGQLIDALEAKDKLLSNEKAESEKIIKDKTYELEIVRDVLKKMEISSSEKDIQLSIYRETIVANENDYNKELIELRKRIKYFESIEQNESNLVKTVEELQKQNSNLRREVKSEHEDAKNLRMKYKNALEDQHEDYQCIQSLNKEIENLKNENEALREEIKSQNTEKPPAQEPSKFHLVLKLRHAEKPEILTSELPKSNVQDSKKKIFIGEGNNVSVSTFSLIANYDKQDRFLLALPKHEDFEELKIKCIELYKKLIDLGVGIYGVPDVDSMSYVELNKYYTLFSHMYQKFMCDLKKRQKQSY